MSFLINFFYKINLLIVFIYLINIILEAEISLLELELLLLEEEDSSCVLEDTEEKNYLDNLDLNCKSIEIFYKKSFTTGEQTLRIIKKYL